MTWNHNIDEAPCGKTVTVTRTVKGEQRVVEETRREYILAVHADGMVVQSYWIPPRYAQSGALLEGNRWSGFNVGRDPIAWAPWPVFEFAAASQGEAAAQTGPTSGPADGGDDVDGSAARAPLITHKHIFLDDCGSGA